MKAIQVSPGLLLPLSPLGLLIFSELDQFQCLSRQTFQRSIQQAFQLPDLFDVKADFLKDLLAGYGV